MMATKATKWLIATLLLSAALLTGASEAIAKGSYSRPSFSSSSSYSRPSISAPSRSSSFGSSSGYTRPSLSAPRPTAPSAAPSRPAPSFGDRQINRSISGSALREYRERRDIEVNRPSMSAPRPSPPSPSVASPSGQPSVPNATASGTAWSRPSAPSVPPTPRAPSWSNPPAPYATTTRSYGGDSNSWLLWWLLANQQHSSSAAWMAAHRDDANVKAWRAEAEEMARNNADLREKLDALDRRVSGLSPTEVANATLPDDVTAALSITRAKAQTRERPASDQEGLGLIGWLFVLSLLAAATLVILQFLRRKNPPMRTTTAARSPAPPPPKTPTMRFIPGHVVQLEYAQFLLADQLKVTAPKGLTASRQELSVTAVGEIGDNQFRLHLGDDAFIAATIGRDGSVAEARFFSMIDEVTPETADEWGLWLSPQDGLIGFPVFETKDGVRYDRVWAPGETQAAPISVTEGVTNADLSERPYGHEMMLYARDTGLSQPAPATEFLLVSATEEGFGSAYVRLWAGIDIPTSSIRSTKA